MKITENLYFYSKKDPFTHFFGRGFTANVFAIDQGNEIWLIDAGVQVLNRPRRIIDAMKKDGLDPTRIRKIFITHAHPDHANGAVYFADRFGCDLYLHEIEAERMAGGDRFFWEDQIQGARGLIKEFFPVPLRLAKWVVKYTMGSMPSLKSIHRLKGDEIFRGSKSDLQVIFTPGHTTGHCCFYSPQLQALFCGDLIDPSFDHKPSLNFSTSDFPAIYQSIDAVSKLDIRYFCSGHGNTIDCGLEQNRELCIGTLKNLDYAKARTIELLREAGSSGMRIADFNGKFPKRIWLLQDQMCVPYSVIKMLEAEHRVQCSDGKFRYVEMNSSSN